MKNNIRLVYSSSSLNGPNTPETRSESIEEWSQLDLFTAHKLNAVIFMKPDAIGIEGLKEIIGTGHIKWIIDLRSIPFVSFSDEPRDYFFNLLESNKVRYFNFYKIKNELSVINNYISNGPTIVFCDKEPTQDSSIRLFKRKLENQGISFSPIYADISNPGFPLT